MKQEAHQRNNHGNMFLLIVCIVVFVFAPLFWLIGQMGPFMLSAQKTQKVVDAAGLLAARDLSQVVFNDPNFGYVSLSNHSAGGTATRALDGECLPVLGINTLVGTIRQNAIIANNLHNETMSELVSQDTGCLGATVQTFNTTFSDLLCGQNNRRCFDMNGVEISPLQDVQKFLTDNLPGNTKLKSLKLSLGWLEGGSETATQVPQPAPLAMIDPEKSQMVNISPSQIIRCEAFIYVRRSRRTGTSCLESPVSPGGQQPHLHHHINGMYAGN